MIFSKYDDIKIAAIAASVPHNEINIAAMLDDPEEDPKFIKQFMKNTGIKAKRKSGYEQTAGDYSYSAAKQIMDAGYYHTDT